LPRADESSADTDNDPRSIYFKQAARGVPIRMAILSYLLGAVKLDVEPHVPETRLHAAVVGANPCPNPTCIARTEARHVTPMFKVTSRLPLRAQCAYCSQDLVFRVVGCSTTRHYHEPDSPDLRKVRTDHLVFLRDPAEAESLGYDPAVRTVSSNG